MKKINLFVLMFVIVVLLMATALSQISPITSVVSKTSQATPTISIEQQETCTTSFYDEIQPLYGDCTYYNNYTLCLNTSGSNTACSPQQSTWNFQCKTGEITFARNLTECKPHDKFIVSINKGAVVEKKEIDFSQWGACIQNTENNCLIVTCVSNEDGAFKGQFTDCKGGKSCQKFEICDNKVRVFYKNSREDFVEEDPTFYLSKLALMEVGK
ncbi:hypothetical protein HYT53_02385 [Candidatus Woesearchaeota archaeon]|nr:hypothetical protein [Candidatus Woesearchaeota archaeon]